MDRRVDLAILDWNGTALDDKEYVFGGITAIFEHYGLKPPPPETYFDETQPDYLSCYKNFGVPQSATTSDLNQIWRAHFDKHRNGGQVRPGTRELLLWARSLGLRVFVVSGEASSILQRRLDEFNLRQLLDSAEGDCIDKGQALKRLSAKLGVACDRFVYIDDNRTGLTSAKTFGAKTIGFLSGWQTPGKIGQARPDFMAHTMHDVRRIIEGLI